MSKILAVSAGSNKIVHNWHDMNTNIKVHYLSALISYFLDVLYLIV